MNQFLTPQSKSRRCRFPGSYVAARELGVSCDHLIKVLKGERESRSLLRRWNEWLLANPEFLKANQDKRLAADSQAASPAA